LARLAASTPNDDDLAGVADRVTTVATEARCFLAHQHQRVIDGLLRRFPDAFRRHLAADQPAAEPEPIVPILDLHTDGSVELDLGQLDKQPDWSFDETYSGQTPVD